MNQISEVWRKGNIHLCWIICSIGMVLFLVQPTTSWATEWQVPLAGNTFRTVPEPGGKGLRQERGLSPGNSNEIYSAFFHIDRPAAIDLAWTGKLTDGSAKIQFTINQQTFDSKMDESDQAQQLQLGTINIREAGYVRIDIQGLERTGKSFPEISEIVLRSETEGLTIDYVKNDVGNMFYWGRRGPSVHLTYSLPRDIKVQYGYCELTIPSGNDPLGSYFMANGFGEGYFGMQVNGPKERRILFSVWSPFQTDDPKNIPLEQRIECIAKGPDVRVGEFGNEGSGGQSFLVYPWTADVTYRFLTEVKPDGQGKTQYTSWFGNKEQNEWRLIASFKRPKTDTYLRGFHSFLESFDPSFGHIVREGRYGNVWVRDTESQWHECTTARLSVDNTGGKRQRLDFAGGADGDHFYLKNCGFFSGQSKAGESFERSSTEAAQPTIDFESLPRGN